MFKVAFTADARGTVASSLLILQKTSCSEQLKALNKVTKCVANFHIALYALSLDPKWRKLKSNIANETGK